MMPVYGRSVAVVAARQMERKCVLLKRPARWRRDTVVIRRVSLCTGVFCYLVGLWM